MVKINRTELRHYVAQIFQSYDLSLEHAEITADVLTTADARGIPSHGVARLWRYLNGIEHGIMLPSVIPSVLRETPSSIVYDAGGAMGAPVSFSAMKEVLKKAEKQGSAFASVRDSNHFGIAGYYSMMALEKDMIGICMTNTAALGVPTFGRDVMFGTNPISIAVPAGNEHAFVLDMSTTAIPRGKVEVYDRENKELPAGWAVNQLGLTATDPASLLSGMLDRTGGGLLPLGGEGETFGGHKGFGLAVMVDIFTALLSGGDFGINVADTEETSARVTHFFGAIRIDMFRDLVEFKIDMDSMLHSIRTAKPAEGAERVYYAGLKEKLNEIRAEDEGIPLTNGVWESVCSYGKEKGIEAPRVL